jgi:hypothetical protein
VQTYAERRKTMIECGVAMTSEVELEIGTGVSLGGRTEYVVIACVADESGYVVLAIAREQIERMAMSQMPC